MPIGNIEAAQACKSPITTLEIQWPQLTIGLGLDLARIYNGAYLYTH